MSSAGDLNDRGSKAWGYGLLQNPLARSWESHFGAVLAPVHPEDDWNTRTLSSPAGGSNLDLTAKPLPLVPWSIEQLVRDEGLRRTQAPRIEAKVEALTAATGDDDVALKVLGVLFLAAGVTMPEVVKTRVLHAFDREIGYVRVQKEASGWNHWSKRVGILRAVRALIERGGSSPVYAGDKTIWALCDNSDLDGFLLTSMEPHNTGLPTLVSVRACDYGTVTEGSAIPAATLAVATTEPPNIYASHALITIEEPVRQVFGPALPGDQFDRVAQWIALNRKLLLDHWIGLNDSSTLFKLCEKLA